MVTQPPPGSGTGFQHHQIFRAEQHRRQHTGDLAGGLFLGTVAPDLPRTGCVEDDPAQGLFPVFCEDFAFDIRKIRPKPDHFLLFQGPEAFSGANIGDGFQQVGLTLGIVAHDQIHAGLKIQFQIFIVAEIPQLNLS